MSESGEGPKIQQARRPEQERDLHSGLSKDQRRKGLAGLGIVVAAGTLAVATSLPSSQEASPNFEEDFKGKNLIILVGGTAVIEKGVNIRTSEKISKSEPNTVDWDSVIIDSETENGSLANVKEIIIKNPVITFGDNPDKNIPNEQNKPGEWINFPDSQGRWLKVSLSDKTAGFVHTDAGERISGNPDSEGGFMSEDKSTTLSPEEIAVVQLVKIDK